MFGTSGSGEQTPKFRIAVDTSDLDRALRKVSDVSRRMESEISRINRATARRTEARSVGASPEAGAGVQAQVEAARRRAQAQMGSALNLLEKTRQEYEREINMFFRAARRDSIRSGQREINATQAMLAAVNAQYLQRVERFRGVRENLPIGFNQRDVRDVTVAFSNARIPIVKVLGDLRELRADLQQIRLSPDQMVPTELLNKAKRLREIIDREIQPGVKALDNSIAGLGRAGVRSVEALRLQVEHLGQALVPVGLALGASTGLGVRAAGERQRVQHRFEHLYGDPGKAEEMMDRIAKKARELNVPVMRAQAAMLLYAPSIGEAADRMDELLDLTVRLAAVDPGTGGGITGAAFAIQEAMSSIFNFDAKNIDELGGDLLSLTERFQLSRRGLRQEILREGDFIRGLDAYLKKFGATTESAREFGRTFAGAMTIAGGSLQDLMATAFEPATRGIADLLLSIANVAQTIDEQAPVLARVAGNFIAISAAVAGLSFVISQLIAGLIALRGAMAGVTLFGLLPAGIPLAPVLAALAAVTTAVTVILEIVRQLNAESEKLDRQTTDETRATNQSFLNRAAPVPIFRRFGIRTSPEEVYRRVEENTAAIIGQFDTFAQDYINDYFSRVRAAHQDFFNQFAEQTGTRVFGETGLPLREETNLLNMFFEQVKARRLATVEQRYGIEQLRDVAEQTGLELQQVFEQIAFSEADAVVRVFREMLVDMRQTGQYDTDAIFNYIRSHTQGEGINEFFRQMLGGGFGQLAPPVSDTTLDVLTQSVTRYNEIVQAGVDELNQISSDKIRQGAMRVRGFLQDTARALGSFSQESGGILGRLHARLQAELELSRISSNTQESLSDLIETARQYAIQVGRERQQLMLAMQDEVDDFWRNRLRQDKEFQKQLLDFDEEMAQAEAEIYEQIAELQEQSNQQTIEAIDKFNKESARQLEDHMNNLARIRRDASDDIEDAVARRDFAAAFRRIRDRDKAIADAELQYSITQQRRLEDLNDLIANLNQQRNERLADYIKQLADLRQNNLERRAEMIREFYERRALEDEDRRIRLERQRRDQELAQFYRDQDFNQQIQDLKNHNSTMQLIRQNGFTDLETAFDALMDGLVDQVIQQTNQLAPFTPPPGVIYPPPPPVFPGVNQLGQGSPNQGTSLLFGQGLLNPPGSGLIGSPVYLGSQPGGIPNPPPANRFSAPIPNATVGQFGMGGFVINLTIPFSVSGVVDHDIVNQIIERAENTIVPAIGRTIRSIWN